MDDKIAPLMLRLAIIAGVFAGIKIFLDSYFFKILKKRRTKYYREDYLKSDAWKAKRQIVLDRDGHRCRICGNRATQVHHTRYAKKIGSEPIEWLIAICNRCHRKEHKGKNYED